MQGAGFRVQGLGYVTKERGFVPSINPYLEKRRHFKGKDNKIQNLFLFAHWVL